MKIACATTYDANNQYAFGGRGYYMMHALSSQIRPLKVSCLGPLVKPKYFSKIARIKEDFYGKRSAKYYPQRDRILIKSFARQIKKKLSSSKPDIIFSPTSPGSQPIAYLDCKQPIVIWTDATFAGVLDFYPTFKRDDICRESIRDGIANERAALQGCSLLICKSEWTAKTAIENYQIEESKIRVIPGGPHVSNELTIDEVKDAIQSRPSKQCNLLFIGYDWHRKGGDIALQLTKRLNQLGLRTKLTIVGAQPDLGDVLPKYIYLAGRVNKNTLEGAKKFEYLVAEAHFIVLPTQADCTPIVIAEGNAFGVPSIASNVGGIGTIIRDDMNGKIFANREDIDGYCTYILDLFSDYSRYQELAISSFNEYRNRLSWVAAGREVTKQMEQLL